MKKILLFLLCINLFIQYVRVSTSSAMNSDSEEKFVKLLIKYYNNIKDKIIFGGTLWKI